MKFLKLAHKLDSIHPRYMDEIDNELIRIAQDAQTTDPVMPSVTPDTGNDDSGSGSDNGPASTNLIDPADSQIYNQLARHVLVNKNDHTQILQRLKALEDKMYNVPGNTQQ